MAEMTPQQQNLLRYLVPLLQAKESAQAAVGPSALGTVLDMILPSSQTVEKMSYGDMPFRMPTQSRIPITTDKQYLADLIGVAGALTPAAKPVQRGVQQLVREIQTTVPRGQVRLPQQPVMQAATPKAPPVSGLLEPVKSDIGFYSQLEAATIPLQNKGTGAQYLAQISKTQGVKPEELQWTGLDEFLRSKQSVTKAEIQDYLNANRVDVQEVRLSDEIDPEEVRMFMADEAGEGFTYNEAVDYLRDGDSVTKFSKYTLPGGENYREILLTLPFKEPKMPKGYEVSSMQYDDGTVRYFAETPTTRSAGYKTEAEAQSELQRMTEGLKDWRASQASYRSSHFDQPNILAHMRVNDRVVNGKKTLFIEEVQSDWHQAGRKKGYQQPPNEARVVEINQRLRELAKSDMENTPEWDTLTREKESLTSKTGVPDAPFKTSWHELTLKRAIQEASEKGYDQIAFTTGKTQAERYDLSKQISKVKYSPPGSKQADKYGTVLKAYDKTGNEVINKSVSPEELPDYLGKEVADRLLKSDESYTGVKSLSGIDLQVGGEGMKGFYDNILPKSLEKLGKKFDAKVGKTEMDGVEVWQMDITPKMRESVTTKGQPLFAIPAIGAGLLGASMYQDEPMY